MIEKLNDIVREMRKRFEPYAKSDSNDARYVAYLGYAEFADRIEAAVKREREATCKESLQVGNAAEMREAMVKCRELAETIWQSEGGWDVSSEIAELKDTIDAALSEPPRNCDKCLTPKDAMLAHLEEVYEGEKIEFGDYEWCVFVIWLFDKAKGETK